MNKKNDYENYPVKNDDLTRSMELFDDYLALAGQRHQLQRDALQVSTGPFADDDPPDGTRS